MISAGPSSPDHYGKIVDRVAEKAGIRKIHPHMFRHTFVSILLSNPDIGVATVAAEAGHAQPSTTLAIYTQVYHKRQDSIRSQMSETLYKRKTPKDEKRRANFTLARLFFGGPCRIRTCDNSVMSREF